MKIKNFLILFIILLNFVSIKAFIFRIEALENQLNDKQYIIKAGDAHFGCQNGYEHPKLSNSKLAKINKSQACHIVKFAENFECKDCLFILEDMYEYTGNNKKIQKIFYQDRLSNQQNNFTTCMDNINGLCKQKNIDVINIEFRQSKTLFFDSLEITAGIFLKDFNNLIKEVKNYNDNEFANKHYKKEIDRILKQNKYLLQILEKNKDFYFNQIKNPITDIDLDKFNEDMCDLIDIRIVHSILQNPHKKFICICAGDTHIQRVKKILEKFDFKTIYKTQNYNIYSPLNLKNYLNKIVTLFSEVEFPNIFIFVIIIILLSVKFPRRFKILHLHYLKS